MPIVPNPLGWPVFIIVIVVIIVGTAYIMWDESQHPAADRRRARRPGLTRSRTYPPSQG